MTFTRIAPTPSGYLHIGNLYSFVLTWLLARRLNGRVQLRIDDLDAERTRPEYVKDIFQTLGFFRLAWDEGPANARDFFANCSQHTRIPKYEELLSALVESGRVYACACSRQQLKQKGAHTCLTKLLPLETPGAAWRIHTPAGTTIIFEDEIGGSTSVDLSAVMPDFVIRKKNGLPAYQVASLSDDVLSGINTIIRGEDLKNSTAAQLYLAHLAGLGDFHRCLFYHHPVITGEEGKKLSKSAGSRSVQSFIGNGVSRERMLSSFREDPLVIQLGLSEFLGQFINDGNS